MKRVCNLSYKSAKNLGNGRWAEIPVIPVFSLKSQVTYGHKVKVVCGIMWIQKVIVRQVGST